MPPVAPTECKTLKSEQYAAYGISFQVWTSGFVPSTMSQGELQSLVNTAVEQSTDAGAVVQFLVANGAINTTADQELVTKVVAATMLLASRRDPTNGWSCCLNEKGVWYPFHPYYGWDESQKCDE